MSWNHPGNLTTALHKNHSHKFGRRPTDVSFAIPFFARLRFLPIQHFEIDF